MNKFNNYKQGWILSALLAVSVLSCTSAPTATTAATDKWARKPSGMITMHEVPAAVTAPFDLKECSGTYYEFVNKQLAPKMLKSEGTHDNDTALQNGEGVWVKLNDDNYNAHINYDASPQSGRSYGWTRTAPEVGDWSDSLYLSNLSSNISKLSDAEMTKFFSFLIQQLADCNTSAHWDLDSSPIGVREVATNFLAIYTAEQYRATRGTKNWDDAILEVTLLAAFHSGQDEFSKIYMGAWDVSSRAQESGVYDFGKQGRIYNSGKCKHADLTDYWQDSPNPGQRRSGINESRADFLAMGKILTTHERGVHAETIDAVEKVVGNSSNVIFAISQFLVNGKTAANAADFGKDVAALLMDLKNDAKIITKAQNPGQAPGCNIQ